MWSLLKQPAAAAIPASRPHTHAAQWETDATGEGILSLLALFNAVATAANDSAEVGNALNACFEAVCGYTRWPVAHAYRPDRDGRFVSTRRWYIAPQIDAGLILRFREMSEETGFAPGAGMVGRVVSTGQAVVLADVGQAPGFLRAAAAEANGIRGCFAVPVLIGRRVVLVLEFFSREVAVMDEVTLRLMTYVGGQIARVVERSENNRQLRHLSTALESQVQAVAASVCSAAEAVAEAARELAAAAEVASHRSVQASRGSEHIMSAVSAVASATTDFESSSAEIRTWVGRTDRIARTATDSASATEAAIDELDGAVDHVDKVIDGISRIARSINILALNAAIEAKRSGEAGRGFEVIAAEVRSMAGQAASATNEVRDIVQHIKTVGLDTRQKLGLIGSVVSDMALTSDGIRQSLESQTSITKHVVQRIGEAGRDTATVAENVDHLEQSTDKSRCAAAQLLDAATDLTGQGQTLAGSIQAFLDGIQQLLAEKAES